MPHMIPLRKIVLQRGKDAERITPTIGVPFEFTKEEVDELKKQSTVARPLIREPKNEMAGIAKSTKSSDDGDDDGGKTAENSPPATKSRGRVATKNDDL